MAQKLAQKHGSGASAMHNEVVNKLMRDSMTRERFI
jgi:hypothetical protein